MHFQAIFTIFAVLFVYQVTFSYHIPDDLKKSLLALHETCMEKTQASVPHLQKCREGHIPEDHDAKCYLHCMISQSTVDLEQRFQFIAGVKHEISEDIHEWKTHVNNECDTQINHDDVCEQAWQRVNCYLKTHNDTMEYCLLFMFQEKYLIDE